MELVKTKKPLPDRTQRVRHMLGPPCHAMQCIETMTRLRRMKGPEIFQMSVLVPTTAILQQTQ